MTKKFKALAYIYAEPLLDLGDFATREEADRALNEEIDKQLEYEEYCNYGAVESLFWEHSKIVDSITGEEA